VPVHSAEYGPPITIRTAKGVGRTELSAWDDALANAGVANFNLIRLSSVIPRFSTLSFNNDPVPGNHGDRLYCVYASAVATEPDTEVCAGIGWVRDDTGRGLFVEHHGSSEKEVLELIRLSLEDMNERRDGAYGAIDSVTVTARWEDRPACALAAASYEVAGWGPA